MSEFNKISLLDIVIGQPLPWDVMDDTGRLLLRAGFVIEDASQAEKLVERGMYVEKKLKKEGKYMDCFSAHLQHQQGECFVLSLCFSCRFFPLFAKV